MSTNGKQHSEQPETGGGGELFTRPDNLRSDARLAAKMISLGVITEQRAKWLLKKGFMLAADCAKSKNPRGYAACMKIAIEAAKLERDVLPKEINHRHSGTIGLAAIREEMLNDPDLIDFRRRQALECDTDPGTVCEIRQPGQVENGKAPGRVGPGANGSSNGKH